MASTSGFFVARKAARDVRKATVSSIDSSLGVVSTPVLVTRKGSTRLGLPLKNGRRVLSVPNPSLAMLIILARMKVGSKVNELERYRYQLSRETFSPGGGQSGFLAAVTLAATKMGLARHKSIAFIASSVKGVITDLQQWVDPRYRRGAPPPDSQMAAAAKLSLTPKGQATVTQGGNSAVMTADMLIGVGGIPANLNEPHNEAMQRWLGPAIQKAIYDEQGKQQAYAAGKQEMLDRSNRFAAAGVSVT